MEPELPHADLSFPAVAVSARMPLAVVVVNGKGLISHWSAGARRLFGFTRDEALGGAAAELLPVAGVLDAVPAGLVGDDPGSSELVGAGLPLGPEGLPRGATAGRFWRGADSRGARDVLWWVYPLAGSGSERLLILATDGARVLPSEEPEELMAAGFAPRRDFPGAEELARQLPQILPNMSPRRSNRIVEQVLGHGYPVLEINRRTWLPIAADWGVPRRVERRSKLLRAAEEARAAGEPDGIRAAEAELAPELEYAAVRERLEFLNEVSGKIGSSLDLAITIREVTSAVVPRFADFAGTHLHAQVLAGEGFVEGPPDASTIWHRVWVEHNDEPGRWDDTVPVGEALAFPERTPFFQCMVTGQPVLVERVGEKLAEQISGQFEKRDLRPLVTGRSLLIVPLKARNLVLGFMVLMRRPEREPFGDMDRTTGAEMAARAGLVLDNARMYTQQETVAETLQDSMLPRVRPRMAACDTATRYLPGARLGRVGGDWFDTVKLPGARTALVVGDVMGHGLNSAAMMGQLRTAVQTMAAMDTPPAQLLRNLDDLAQRLGDHYLATCLYAVYDPIRAELRIANAGHIPPVLVRAADGRSELLDIPKGAPIGVGGVPFETVTVPAAPGDRIVMCTDGLVEVRGQDIGIGLAALCASAAHPAASMDDACDTIIRALNTEDGRKDDVALLMARLNGLPDWAVARWPLALDSTEVGRARKLVRERLRDWSLERLTDQTELLVSEIVTNALRYANDRVELRLIRMENALLCEVADDHPKLPALCDADPDQESGRGLRVVTELAASWGGSHTEYGKTVWFEQPLH